MHEKKRKAALIAKRDFGYAVAFEADDQLANFQLTEKRIHGTATAFLEAARNKSKADEDQILSTKILEAELGVANIELEAKSRRSKPSSQR